MNEFIINAETMEIVKEVAENATGKFLVITKADELVEQLDKDTLVKLRTGIRGKEAKGDLTKSAKKLAFECWTEMNKPEKEKKAPKKKGPAKVTKVSIAREVLKAKGTISKKDLAEAVGHDLQNCHTMISILKNPTRTKDPLFVSYDKASTMYTLHETKEAMDEATTVAVQAAVDAKAKVEAGKKANAEEKKTIAAEKKTAEEKAAAEKAAANADGDSPK